MRTKAGEIDPTPSKRLFLSIISDYDLQRSVSELIDNAIDQKIKARRRDELLVQVSLDLRQRTIVIEDNAGGVRRDALEVLVGPGHSGNEAADPTIGIFGVGTKRAVVALAESVNISSRFGRSKTYAIEFDDHWLNDESSWVLPIYETDEIAPASTVIDLSRLRVELSAAKVEELRTHLACTYARFISSDFMTLRLNGEPVQPQVFENWAYPPQYEPREYSGQVNVGAGVVELQAIAGLSRESSPGSGEYGVYFYCNERLVARALKTFEVGFSPGIAGSAHPALSLVRVIVGLKGPAAAMPWNSSKSGINYGHATFLAIRGWLHSVVTDYSKLSRNWQGNWSESVFAYDAGQVVRVDVPDLRSESKSYLPPLPLFRPRYPDRVAKANARVFSRLPFARGLADGVVAATMLQKTRLVERNRFALILLDSTLEIAFKDFLVYVSGKHYSDRDLLTLFSQRHLVLAEVKTFKPFDSTFWSKVKYYYALRCKLVHERATAAVSDSELSEFRSVVEIALKQMFGLRFSV